MIQNSLQWILSMTVTDVEKSPLRSPTRFSAKEKRKLARTSDCVN